MGSFARVLSLTNVLVLVILFGLIETSRATVRLPRDTKPIHYDLQLTTNIHSENYHFTGKVTISAKCVIATDKITLHSSELDIQKVSVRGVTVDENNIKLDEGNSFLIISLPDKIGAEKTFDIVIEYAGVHNDNQSGWYRVKENLTDSWYAVSQFEPIGARRAFPCYDEPNLKATFTVSITHSPKYLALSNMKESKQNKKSNKGPDDKDMVTTTFEKSIVMSTYIVAFVVAPLKSNCKVDEKNRTHCIYVQEQYLNETGPALAESMFAVERFENLFKIDYPLTKLDHVEVPDEYFESGAMENIGLIIYRKSHLLTPLPHNPVIHHEIAHQWFGNMVTLDWWTHTWLNEAMASLFQFTDMSQIFPFDLDFFNEETLVQNDTVLVMRETPYTKGWMVMSMVFNALPNETFYKGIRYYLNDHLYSNVVPEDLYKGLQKAADEDKALPPTITITALLDPWIKYKGYPIVTANRTSPTEVLLQVRKSIVDTNPSFIFPITFADQVDGLRKETHFLSKENVTITVNEASKWYIVTMEKSSLHQVEYEDENWLNLADQLSENHTALSEMLRLSVIRQANSTKSVHLTKLCRYAEKETSVIIKSFCPASEPNPDPQPEPNSSRSVIPESLLFIFMAMVIISSVNM